MTTAEAHKKAIAAIEAARTEPDGGPLFADFAREFTRR